MLQCVYCKNKYEEEELKLCGNCLSYHYCSTECQKNDWNNHKLECFPYSDVYNYVDNSKVLKAICTNLSFNRKKLYETRNLDDILFFNIGSDILNTFDINTCIKNWMIIFLKTSKICIDNVYYHDFFIFLKKLNLEKMYELIIVFNGFIDYKKDLLGLYMNTLIFYAIKIRIDTIPFIGLIQKTRMLSKSNLNITLNDLTFDEVLIINNGFDYRFMENKCPNVIQRESRKSHVFEKFKVLFSGRLKEDNCFFSDQTMPIEIFIMIMEFCFRKNFMPVQKKYTASYGFNINGFFEIKKYNYEYEYKHSNSH
jgi:hypothetical protein